MHDHSISRLSDRALLDKLSDLVQRERTSTADLLMHLAEVDARRLYLPAGQPSMFSYCVNVLRMSEASTMKRIHAARAARSHPALLSALVDGRLHLTAIVMLAPHVTPSNVRTLISKASHRSKSELERLVAELAPRPDVPTSLRAVPNPAVSEEQAPRLPQAGEPAVPTAGLDSAEPHDSRENQHAPGHVGNIGLSADSSPVLAPPASALGASTTLPTSLAAPSSRPVLAPLSATRFELRCTLGEQAHDRLRYAQSLLGHSVPSGDLAQVLERAIDALVDRLERRVFAAGARLRAPGGESKGRYIPAHVRNQVWLRDEGRCTFTNAGGQRCPAQTWLQFDHAKPVACGGESTLANLRLRCRAHNQYTAEQAFGPQATRRRRIEVRRKSSGARATTRASA